MLFNRTLGFTVLSNSIFSSNSSLFVLPGRPDPVPGRPDPVPAGHVPVEISVDVELLFSNLIQRGKYLFSYVGILRFMM